jgi:hypothetical protein
MTAEDHVRDMEQLRQQFDKIKQMYVFLVVCGVRFSLFSACLQLPLCSQMIFILTLCIKAARRTPGQGG